MSPNALCLGLITQFVLDSLDYKGLKEFRSKAWNKARILIQK